MPEKAPVMRQLASWDRFLDDCAALDAAVKPNLLRASEIELTDLDRDLARRLLTELSTRITATELRYRDGDESAALDSLYQIFVKARESIVESGDQARAFTGVTIVFLEKMLRPFTGHWHGRKLTGALNHQDERRRFRRQLPRLRGQLDSFRCLLEDLSGRHEIALPPSQVSARGLDESSLWPVGYIGPEPDRGADRGLPTLDHELEQISVRRQLAYASEPLKKYGGLGEGKDEGQTLGLMGLALSGGGIRSATFCLGVVQTLAEFGVLRDFDYLSTVSGGGYLGSFLSSRLHRRARDLEKKSYDEVLGDLLTKPDGRTGDSASVRWLRNNSKYLLSRDAKELRRTALHIAKGLLPGFPSLHSLYRDRLARGYLHEDYEGSQSIPRVSELVDSPAPYHLINTSVNLPASRNPELRGRRSDFFVISPHYTGSVVTGYCNTREVEKNLGSRERFDLGSAMAISGAAVSSHMGMRRSSALVRSLLVAANVRLGYWLPNPGVLGADESPSLFSFRNSRWRELRGNFDETDDYVNLSDGGHVENLGLYELLRRRCKFIVAVDGECDPARRSGSLVKATRLAKIDLGVEVDIDVSDLQIDESECSQTHWAFGTIDYNPRGDTPEIGYLLYLKLSITGNEPAYVKEYRSRFPAFPHQSTADQIFDEDQFEAYRALGEHVALDVFGIDVVPDEDLTPSDAFRSRRWLEGLVREFL